MQQLEAELQSLSSNTTNIDELTELDEDSALAAVERLTRAVRPTSGRRYSGRTGNATTRYTGSGRSRTRSRLRQRPHGAATKKGAQKAGGRRRWRNRGRKFRGRNRMRYNKQTGGADRPKMRPTAAPDRKQSDAAYVKAPSMSDVGGDASRLMAEGHEEMTNKLEPSGVGGGHWGKQQQSAVPHQDARWCEKMRCRRGGRCVVEDRPGRPARARCQCPLGTKGHHCESGPPCPSLRFPSISWSHISLSLCRDMIEFLPRDATA